MSQTPYFGGDVDTLTYLNGLDEATFMAKIRVELVARGFRVYHTHRSDRSDPGYPDLHAVGNGRSIHLEVKRGQIRTGVASEAVGVRGSLSEDQRQWLHCLAANGGEAFAVWPDDWHELIACLDGRPHTLTQGPPPSEGLQFGYEQQLAARKPRRYRPGAGGRHGGRGAGRRRPP